MILEITNRTKSLALIALALVLLNLGLRSTDPFTQGLLFMYTLVSFVVAIAATGESHDK